MRHLTALLLAAVLCVVSVVSAPGPAHAYSSVRPGTPPDRVAVISDSYTNGTNFGGQGPRSWPAQADRNLDAWGVPIIADVAAEGRAGYVVRGDHGSIFRDLTARAVRPDDALVVFFGSRNDQGADLMQLSGMAHDAFMQARATAPGAKLLVIGPPWPTADVPPAVLQIRDVLGMQAGMAGATFIDPIAERWFVDRPDLIAPDGVHPTDAGHDYLAGLIAPRIRAELPIR